MRRMMQPTYPARGLRLPSWLLISGVLLGVIGYSAAIGFLAARGSLIPLVLMIAAPVGLVACMIASRYFHILVLALPIAALTLPFIEVPTGTYSKLPLSLLITLLLAFIWGVSLYTRGWKVAPSPLNRPLVIFSIICIISLPWGIIWRDPILRPMGNNFIVTQIGGLMTILASPIAAWLIGNFIKTERQIKYIFGCFIVFGALMTITQFFNINQNLLNDRGLWGLWHVAPLFGLMVAQPGIHWRWRALFLILIGWNLYQTVVVNSLWISGWLPTVIAMMLIAFLHSWKFFFGMIGVVAVAGAQPIYEYLHMVAEDNVEEGGLERLELWAQNWRVVSEHWLFGTGPAGYAIYYMTFFRDDARSTHNNYLDILAQFGFVGMIVWIWVSVVSVWEGWRLIQRAPVGILRTTALIATGGWISAMIAMFFGDWVLPFAYNQGIGGFKYTVYSWIYLGLMITLRQMLDARDRAEAEAEAEAKAEHA